MTSPLGLAETGFDGTAPIAIVVDGIPERWGLNVVQIRGRAASARVEVEGHGTIDAPAILLSQAEARRLAIQILEMLGREDRNSNSLPLDGTAGVPATPVASETLLSQ